MTMPDEIVATKKKEDRHGRWYPVGVTHFADESATYHHDRIVTALKAQNERLIRMLAEERAGLKYYVSSISKQEKIDIEITRIRQEINDQ